jgi:hypothetical protein
MLKIKWTVTQGELKPVYYELQNVDLSFAHLLTNPKYGLKTVILSTLPKTGGGVFYSRKVDFSGMKDGETKTVKSIYAKYKITAVSGMANVAMMGTVLQCINWPRYKFFDFSKTVDTGSFAPRMKIERFLFVTDLQQLQETVHFELQTPSNVGNYEGKSIEVSLNIYDTPQ